MVQEVLILDDTHWLQELSSESCSLAVIFFTGKTYWWNSFWFKLWKRWPYWIWFGHWTSDQRWLIWQWIGYSLFWLCSVSLSEFLYFLCRMGSGSPGNVRWWKAEVEDPIKAWLWASRLATYYPWYVFFNIFCSLSFEHTVVIVTFGLFKTFCEGNHPIVCARQKHEVVYLHYPTNSATWMDSNNALHCHLNGFL